MDDKKTDMETVRSWAIAWVVYAFAAGVCVAAFLTPIFILLQVFGL